MKPVIIIIVYRRYFELVQNYINIFAQCKSELGRTPIVIIWSDPDNNHYHIIKSLNYDFLLRRQMELGENKYSISYHCSRDILLGLNFVKQHFGPQYYSIVHCCDVCPQVGIYSSIHHCMKTKSAYLVSLPNTVVSKNIWHTNFFAVNSDERYWPPIINPEDSDILERKWGKLLLSQKLSNFDYNGNFTFKTFNHVHSVNNYNLYKKVPYVDA